MSKKELERLSIIHRVMDKRLTQKQGAEFLEITVRHVRRLVSKIKIGGDEAIIHKNRCRQSAKKMPQEREMEIISIIKQNYSEFPPLHASQKLAENDKIVVSKEKVRQLMIIAGVWKAKPKKHKQIHQWRKRKEHRGELVQMDGSDHDWLESRGPRIVLMGMIDDATGDLFGRFYEAEGTFAAMDCFRRYIVKYGIPMNVYLDRHSTYRATRQQTFEEQLKGAVPRTQFGRALDEINVNVIYAFSPQAKGRIERVFRTLQERLVREMRLSKVCTLDDANRFLNNYLKLHNRQFAKLPMKKTNLHRPLDATHNLEDIFCIKSYRTIGDDYTISYNNRLFLVKLPYFSMRRKRVLVIEKFTGRISFIYKGKRLLTKEVSNYDVKYLESLKKALRKIGNVPLKVIESWEDVLLNASS